MIHREPGGDIGSAAPSRGMDGAWWIGGPVQVDTRRRRDRRIILRGILSIVAATVLLTPLLGRDVSAGAPATADAWEALRTGGNVVLVRHALAPGTGDPPGFVLEDCATQRNLSDGGRAQAVRLGDAFRANGVAVDRVLSSGWCRCVETAMLAFGAAEVWPPLHSFFSDSATETVQTAETRAAVAAWAGSGTLVLVTHQVNITALTGIFPDSGEVIVLEPAPSRPEGFTLVGRLAIP